MPPSKRPVRSSSRLRIAGASASGLTRWACAARGTVVTTAAAAEATTRVRRWRASRFCLLLVIVMFSLARRLVRELRRQVEADADVSHHVVDPLRVRGGLGLVERHRRGPRRRLVLVGENVVA